MHETSPPPSRSPSFWARVSGLLRGMPMVFLLAFWGLFAALVASVVRFGYLIVTSTYREPGADPELTMALIVVCLIGLPALLGGAWLMKRIEIWDDPSQEPPRPHGEPDPTGRPSDEDDGGVLVGG